MRHLFATASATLVMTCLVASAAQAQRHLVGNLMCTAAEKEAGENVRTLECRMRSVEGPPASYTGSISRLRDVAHTNEQLVFNWSVLSNSGQADSGALEGRYAQQPAQLQSLSPTNLVGGKDNNIVLQPLDDFGGAFAVLELELTATRV